MWLSLGDINLGLFEKASESDHWCRQQGLEDGRYLLLTSE